MSNETYAIQLNNITKTFGSVVANKNVNLSLKQGEILALLGENGSGKTTLMNMLSGIYQPDAGSITVNGEPVFIHSPEDSKRLGIGMIHQHFKLVDVYSAADNIWMGMPAVKYGLKEKLSAEKGNAGETFSVKSKRFFQKAGIVFRAAFFRISNAFLKKKRYAEIGEICKRFGFEIDPAKKVYNMAVSEKQTVEIVKVLLFGAKIIILDEPTAVLTVQEIEKLFAVLRRMKEEGHSVIIITHKLNEVKAISDRVAIMRKGEYITTVNTAETTEQELTDLMVGRKVDLNIERPVTDFDRPLLEIRDLTVKNDEGANAIDGVNFYIRGGEILGVAGIAGCGQKELCEAIAGLRKIESGVIAHKGENIVGLSPDKIIEKGISMSFIPEDRLGMGLAPSMSVTDNMMLKNYRERKYRVPFLKLKEGNEGKKSFRLKRGFVGFANKAIAAFNASCPIVDRKKARASAEQIIRDLEIVTPSSETPVRRLSGGNVQKVLLGREMLTQPNVVVTAYPVRGLDINSSYAIYRILNEQKQNGVGILFVGEDLDVLLALCDKIMVLCHGKLMGVVHAHKTSKEQLGLMMTGSLDLSGEAKMGFAKDSVLEEAQHG